MFVRKTVGVLLCGLLLTSTFALIGCQSTARAHPEALAGTQQTKKYELHRVRSHKGGGFMRTVRMPAGD